MRTALAWALADEGGRPRDAALALGIAGALWRLWYTRGYLSEGRTWLDHALAHEDMAPPAARLRPLNGAGALATMQGDLETAEALFERTLALARDLHDDEAIRRALHNLGIVLQDRGELARARQLAEECLELERRAGDRSGLALSLGALGVLAYAEGDYDRARPQLEESLGLHRALEDTRSVALTLHNLGDVALCMGDLPTARRLIGESAGMVRTLGDPVLEMLMLLNAADLALREGDAPRAVQIVSGADAMRGELAVSLNPDTAASYARFLATARERLSPEEFDAAWAEGRALTRDEVGRIAVAPPGGAPPDTMP